MMNVGRRFAAAGRLFVTDVGRAGAPEYAERLT
jgi:hypothetical protein